MSIHTTSSSLITPVTAIHEPDLEEIGWRIFIKRDDLANGPIQGNKFRKLKYHAAEADRLGKTTLLSFGGAFSNHLFALAYFGHRHKVATIGVVRGEIDPDNPTLQAVKQWGMKLIPLSRTTYRQESKNNLVQLWQSRFPRAHIIPQGGSGLLGMLGVSDMVREIHHQSSRTFDFWVCAFGTGATSAGIAAELHSTEQLWSFPVLRGLDHSLMLAAYDLPDSALNRISIVPAHLGGYAKRVPEVEIFIKTFYDRHQIILDPIYTGKMMYCLYRQLLAGEAPKNPTSILVIHTGGSQGNQGYNHRFNMDLPVPDFFPIGSVARE